MKKEAERMRAALEAHREDNARKKRKYKKSLREYDERAAVYQEELEGALKLLQEKDTNAKKLLEELEALRLKCNDLEQDLEHKRLELS